MMEIRGLKTYYFTRKGVIKAVDDVYLSLAEKEVLGIVGESGCGKSTLAYSILKLVPDPGKIVDGEIIFKDIDLVKLSEDEMRKFRWKHISMIFQGAMNALDPVFTVKDQILEAIMSHEKNVDKEDALNRIYHLLKVVGLTPEVADRYPFELSGGMKQRVVIAMALALNPEIVIADEPTTALDVTIQRQILELFKDLRRNFNISFIIISHDISMIYEIADKIAIMYSGKIVEYGDIDKIIFNPIHPYTKGLIKSTQSVYEEEGRLFSMPGVPDLIHLPKGCRFAPRCPYARQKCREEPPETQAINDVYVQCHYAGELVDIPAEKLWTVESYE